MWINQSIYQVMVNIFIENIYVTSFILLCFDMHLEIKGTYQVVLRG